MIGLVLPIARRSSSIVRRVVALPPATPVRSKSERESTATHKRISDGAVSGGRSRSTNVAVEHNGWPAAFSSSNRCATAGAMLSVWLACSQSFGSRSPSAALAASRSASALRAISALSASSIWRASWSELSRSCWLAAFSALEELHTRAPPIGSKASDSMSSSFAPVGRRSYTPGILTRTPRAPPRQIQSSFLSRSMKSSGTDSRSISS